MFTSNRSIRQFPPVCMIALVARLPSPGSDRLQLRPFGDAAALQVTPQGNRQSPCHRYDGNASDTAVGAGALGAPVEPLGECAAGLIAQPGPAHLDQQRAHPAVTLPVDALVGLALAAVVRLGHQPDTGPDLVPV